MRAALLLAALWLASAPSARADAAPTPVWSAEVRAGSGRLVLVWPSPTRATLARDGSVAWLRAERPPPAPPARGSAVEVPRSQRDSRSATWAGLALRMRPGVDARLVQPHPRLILIELAAVEAPLALVPAPSEAAAAVAAIEPAAGGARPLPVPRSRPGPEMAAPDADPRPAPPPVVPQPVADGPRAAAVEPPSGVTVSAAARQDGLDLRFRWERAVPAAVFERADQLWIVFPGDDRPVAGWRSLARRDVAVWLEPIATTEAGGARAFRFRLARPALIEPRADASGWTIAMRPAADPSRQGGAAPALTRDVAAGELTALTGGVVAQLREPESGARLGVLLAPPDGPRQAEGATLVDLELLPTRHGLAWRPLADGVRASVASDRLTITRPGGLRLSSAASPAPGSEAAGERPAPVAADAVPPPDAGGAREAMPNVPRAPAAEGSAPAEALGLASLGAIDAAARQEWRRRLVGELRTLAGLPRARARLELARLYLADALGPEARTALALMDDAELAPVAATPLRTRRIALTGAAEALSGRPDPALASLLDHALDEDPEIALWRAYAAARAARWPLAAQEWARSGGVPESYPEPLRRRLGLELATLMLEHGEAAEARALMAQLGEVALPATETARLRLLEGIVHDRDGRPAEADAAFAAAGAAGDPDTATRAAFLLASTRAARGAATPAAAVAALVADRSRWRGHPWEARMLGRLAELQAAAGSPAAAIRTRREALARMAEPEAAAALGALRRDLAAQLADGRAPPLRRLALHRAHGDLLAGDPALPGLLAGLAADAAGMGLTDMAASLLDAAGPRAAQAEAATVLAAALVQRGDPERALRRLGEPGAGDTPAAAGLRAELRARAALDAGDPDRAAAALAAVGAGTPLAREIAWRRGAWAELARDAAAELAAAPASTVLGPDHAAAAVWLGLAQARSGRAAEAADVADRYAARLAIPGDASLLRLAAAPPPAAAPEAALAAAGRLIDAVRAGRETLPELAALGGPVRTAAARSGPEG